MINLDYAATAVGCNPAAIHACGREAQRKIQHCRASIARRINAKPEEIYFTSGGTESNNWAIKGVAFANQQRGRHIITTQIEHDSVLEACRFLQRCGFDVTYLPVNKSGYVNTRVLNAAIRSDTILISVMGLNNEIGTYQHLNAIGKIAKSRGVLFHSDCVQLFANDHIDVEEDCIDLMSVSGHKFGAPVGTGFLFVRNGTKIEPLIHGGHQQGGMRAGTEPKTLIADMEAAMNRYLDEEEHEAIMNRLAHISQSMLDEIKKEIPDVRLNGAPVYSRARGNLNLCFPGVDGEALTLMLSSRGIAVSRGSACSSGEYKPSHVLKAIGLGDEDAMSSIRISLTPNILRAEAIIAAHEIVECVKSLRSMSSKTHDGDNNV